MEAPAVSGAGNYQALCVAAKTGERRQAELKKHRQYKPQQSHQQRQYKPEQSHQQGPRKPFTQAEGGGGMNKDTYHHKIAEMLTPKLGQSATGCTILQCTT